MLTHNIQQENTQLANWVSTQRQEYKLRREGKKNWMTTEKIEALTSIGFLWVIPRGCSAQLKYIKTKEMRYKAEVAKREGTEYDLKDVMNAIALADPVFDLPHSFGHELIVPPKSIPALAPSPILNAPQSTRKTSFESKVLNFNSFDDTVVDDCLLRYLSSQQVEFSHFLGGFDHLKGSSVLLPGLLGVTNIYPQANINNAIEVSARFQRSGQHNPLILGGYGDFHPFGIYPGARELNLQHATSIHTNMGLTRANTKVSQQNRDKLLQANLVKSMQLQALAQLRFDHAYSRWYATACQLSSASKLLPSTTGIPSRGLINADSTSTHA